MIPLTDRARSLRVLWAAVVWLGCATGSPRPPYAPVEGALEMKVQAFPYRVIEETVEVFDLVGYPVRFYSVEDGYVETSYVDAVRGEWDAEGWSARQRAVKLQLRADPSNGGSHVVLEVLYRPRSSGGGDRFEVRMVPPRHPAYADGEEILQRLREALGEPVPLDSL